VSFFKNPFSASSFWSSPNDSRIPRWTWFVILAIAFAVLIPGTSVLPLLDRDEPRFARATVEMEQRGDYFVPYFNGEYRFDKPPLTYWWMHADYAVFGHNELGARMHSVLSSAAIALILLAMGRDLFGWRTGFWAAIAYLTLFQVWQHGRLAVADMPMVLGVVVAHWALWKLLTAEKCRKWGLWFWVLWLSLAFGFLAKGPLVFFCLACTLLFMRWVFWRRPMEWGRLQILPGVLISLVPIAAWGIPALVMTHGVYWDQGIGKHVVDRGLGAFDNRVTIPVLFYVATALISLFPWLGRAGAVWETAKTTRRDMRVAFLLSWAVGPYVIFALYATQLPHYVLPAFPALMLLAFAGTGEMNGKWARRWFVWYHTVFCVIIVGLALWFLFGPALPAVKPMMLGFVAILMGLQFAAVNFETKHTVRIGMGFAMLVMGSCLACVGMKKVALSPQIAKFAGSVDGNLAAVGYTEPSLVYYAGKPWKMYSGNKDGLEAAIAVRPAMLVVMRKQSNMGTLLGFNNKKAKDMDCAKLAEERLTTGYVRTNAEGLNIGRFSWTTVDIYLDISGINIRGK
jgi:4-amino-4-deoxy-L-arabinose transferase-like glycosyltransferase